MGIYKFKNDSLFKSSSKDIIKTDKNKIESNKSL